MIRYLLQKPLISTPKLHIITTMIKKYLYVLTLSFLFIACQETSVDLPFTYESESFEAMGNVIFKCLKPADSVRWSFSGNLSDAQTQLPAHGQLTQKTIVAAFYSAGYYNVSLSIFLGGKEQKYVKNLRIFAPTSLDIIVLNQDNQFRQDNFGISLYSTKKDAQLSQNVVSTKSSNGNAGVTFTKLKAQVYYFKIQNYNCGNQTNNEIYATSGPIIPYIANSIRIAANAGEGQVSLINPRGDSRARIYLCRSQTCSSPAPDRKPDYIIEPTKSVTFKVPVGRQSYFYSYDTAFNGFENVVAKCDEVVEKTLGF